jgi:hypothetical protein
MMVGIAFAALAIAWMLALTVAVVFQLVALTRVWFEMPATCSSAADKTATIGKRNAKRPSEGGTSSAQYLLDHIFVYRCNQNLPDKSSDV